MVGSAHHGVGVAWYCTKTRAKKGNRSGLFGSYARQSVDALQRSLYRLATVATSFKRGKQFIYKPEPQSSSTVFTEFSTS